MGYLATAKWKKLARMIRENGGLWKVAYKMWRYDTLKVSPVVLLHLSTIHTRLHLVVSWYLDDRRILPGFGHKMH